MGTSGRPKATARAVLVVVVCVLCVGGAARGDEKRSVYMPRSAAEITAALTKIRQAKVPATFSGESAEALRLLNAYRYLAGVPHDVVLDEDHQKKAQAACDLFVVTGEKSHSPKNPGWPAARFEPAAQGAANSNIGGSSEAAHTVSKLVHSTMYDSDSRNVWRVGHRRWNLNPRMAKTGFGGAGGFRAMWATDGDRRDPPGFEFVAWPPPGLAPVAYVNGMGKPPAWSVHLHPKHYKLPKHAKPVVRMWRVKKAPPEDPKKFMRWLEKLDKKKPIGLEGTERLEVGPGALTGVVWLPQGVSMKAGERFWVDIGGLLDANANIERPLRYFVEGM